MTADLPHIAARAFNTPLLIEPRKAEIIADVLLARMRDDGAVTLPGFPEAARPARRAAALNSFDAEPRDRYLFADGVALIAVHGTMVNRGAWIGQSMSGLSSYEGLAASLAAAASDPEVAAIALDIDSPGGEAAGAFEAADAVRFAARARPVIAFANAMAASAAYAIASAATKIVVTPSAVVGSIGVVMLHLDRSAQLARQGVKPTLIFAGASKVDGNPFEPLPDGVRAQFQGEIDDLYAMFVDTVVRGRAGLSAEAIRATEARMFTGRKAVEAGLADEVGTLGETMAQFQSRGGSSRVLKGAVMANESASPAEAGISIAQHEAALKQAATLGFSEGAKAGGMRIAAILDHAEAKGRDALARHLAFETALDVESAANILKASARAEPVGPAKRDLAASVPRPAVAPEGEPAGPSNDHDAGAAAAVATLKAAGRFRG